ncbi:MAG: glycine cleavage system protein R [Gammaproteobacteria bacterium]
MSAHWYMLSLAGSDRPGIVAAMTQAIWDLGGELGEASMMRLGGNFTVMLMASADVTQTELETAVAEALDDPSLHIHVSPITGSLHSHLEPNLRITVSGADQPGIVARVTGMLAEQGFNILDLESDVGGSADNPIYVLHIEGNCTRDEDAVEAALKQAGLDDLDLRVEAIETLVG